MLRLEMRKLWPWVAGVAAILAATALLLRWQGRLWACACGYVLAWTSDAWSSDNSQHVADPYTLTHVLHGFAFCGLLAWAVPRLALRWRLLVAVAAEAAWEVLENSDFVIRRYREATLALGYTGDTVINSLGDVIACGLGFLLAWRLGFRRSLVVFLVTEVVLLIWIKDGLLLNVLMLLYPLDSIKQWQMGH